MDSTYEEEFPRVDYFRPKMPKQCQGHFRAIIDDLIGWRCAHCDADRPADCRYKKEPDHG